MDPSITERNPVDELAEEFVERYRRGERPPIKEYTDKYPEWADKIGSVFPALVLLEQARPEVRDAPEFENGIGAREPPLVRLGDYRMLREVGRGGMGIVYEAEQESLGRHVALKVLAAHSALDARHVQRFQREARASARLHHTNIVPVHGVGEQDGFHYYVMQFIQGLGLDAVLDELKRLRSAKQSKIAASVDPIAAGNYDRRSTGELSAADVAQALLSGEFRLGAIPAASGPVQSLVEKPATTKAGTVSGVHLPGQGEGSSLTESGNEYWRSVARVGLQVADALAYASSQGILHRDIKPSNLLLDTRGTVWVTDFGLAKAADDTDNLTRSGDVIGTLRYMAPECFQGKADTRSDLYSLGLTLYELVTLRPAFDEVKRSKLIAQVLDDEPPRPRHVEPAVPRDLETIVLKATARDPAHRYQSAAELTDDLQRFLEDRPIKARRLGALARVWRWCRRKPALASLTAAVVLLVVAIGIGSPVALWRVRHEQEATLRQLGRAEKAEKEAIDRLWDSNLAQARARRWSGQPGRHFMSLAALLDAAQVHPSLELRNEAAACIPLVDLQPGRQWRQSERFFDQPLGVAFDAELARYALSDVHGGVSVRRVNDNLETVHLDGFGASAMDLRFSPDGQLLTARYDAHTRLTVWDLAGAKPLFHVDLSPPPGPVGYGAQLFTSDSRRLVVGFGDGSLRTYALPSGKELNRVTLDAAIDFIALDPSGKRLVVARWKQNEAWIIDSETGSHLATLKHPKWVTALGWHPDGALVAAACWDHNIYLWNADTHETERILVGHQNVPMGIEFGRRGDTIATWSWDGTTRLWDTINGKEMVNIAGFFIRIGPDDTQMAYARGWEVGIWDIAAGRQCRTLHSVVEEGYGPSNVVIDPAGRFLASSHDDGVRVWDLATCKQCDLLPVGRCDAVFDRNGTSLLVKSKVGLTRWPIVGGEHPTDVRFGPSQTLNETPVYDDRGISVSQDGRWLAMPVGEQEVDVLNFLDEPSERLRVGPHDAISNVAISPDGSWLVTGTQFGSGIKVWDCRNGQLAHDVTAGNYSEGVFSPDGKLLATKSNGQGTQLWDVGTWKLRHHLTTENYTGTSLAFAADSRVLALGSQPGTIILFDTNTGEELVRLSAPNPLGVGPMAFSQDGRWLAAGCSSQHQIQLWDLRALRNELARLRLDW
jgi:WD40 repeat protein/serine/threonine protein kinase